MSWNVFKVLFEGKDSVFCCFRILKIRLTFDHFLPSILCVENDLFSLCSLLILGVAFDETCVVVFWFGKSLCLLLELFATKKLIGFLNKFNSGMFYH